MATKNPSSKPTVRLRRDRVLSIRETAAWMLEQLPPKTLDLADEAVRAQLQGWFEGVLSRVASSMSQSYARGSREAFRQIAALMRDPDYARHRLDRLAKRRAARSAEAKAQADKQTDELKRLAREGRLKPFRGFKFKFDDQED